MCNLLKKSRVLYFVVILVISIMGNEKIKADEALSALWHFDQGEGAIAYDASSNGNNGTLYGDTTWTIDSKAGQSAVEFNGGHIAVAGSTNLDISNELTITAWVKLADNKRSTIIGRGLSGSIIRIYAFFKESNNKLVFLWSSDGSYANSTTITSVETFDSNWHHVAVTFDNGLAVLYIDGVEAATKSGQTTIYTGAPIAQTTIGYGAWSGGYADGIIDEVGIYRRVLSIPEIENHHDILAASWHFDQGEGIIAYDSSPNGNNGTLYNETAWTIDSKAGPSAVEFNGGHVAVAGSTGLDISNELSITAWVKLADNKRSTIIGRGLSGSIIRIYAFFKESNNKLVFLWSSDGSLANTATVTSMEAFDSNWHHVAVTFDNGLAVLYIDGVEASTNSGVTTIYTGAPIAQTTIGYGAWSGGYADGIIDEISVYGGVLSLTEVEEHYRPRPWINVRKPFFSPNADGLRDKAEIEILPLLNAPSTLVVKQAGQVIRTLLTQEPPTKHFLIIEWDGRDDAGNLVADGMYECEVSFEGETEIANCAIEIEGSAVPLPVPSYTTSNVFPIGIWYEGGIWTYGTTDIQAYYEQTFADIAGNDIDTIVVANCPSTHYTMLLETAATNQLSVILDVGSLSTLVKGNNEPVSESTAVEQAYNTTSWLSSYPALFRYQIADEPLPGEVDDNWVLMQRALASFDLNKPAFSCFSLPSSVTLLKDMTEVTEIAYDGYDHDIESSMTHFAPFEDAAGDTPKWYVLPAYSFNGGGYPSDKELRILVHAYIAHGAKGIFFFIYQTSYTREGLVDLNLNPTPIHATVSSLAARLQGIKTLLLDLKEVAAFAAISPTGPGNIEPGFFEDSLAVKHIILASKNLSNSIDCEITTGSTLKDVETEQIFSPVNGIVTIPVESAGLRILREI